MDSFEQSRDDRSVAHRLTGRFALLWAEHRRLEEQLAVIESSTTWAVARRLAQWRRRLAPEGSRRQTYFRLCLRGLRLWRREGIKAVSRRIAGKLLRRRPPEPVMSASVEVAPARTSAGVLRGPARGDTLPALEAGKFRVAYVGPCASTEAPSLRYRAHHLVEALALVGMESTFVTLEEVPAKLPLILSHDLIVLVRTTYNDITAVLIESARRRGLPMVYDIDDYIFDPWAMPYVEAFRSMSKADALRQMDDLSACLDQCDYFTGSTAYLAEQAAMRGKQSFVIRNGFNAAQQLLSQLALEQPSVRRRDGRTRIGYFSGTRSHQADFRVAYPALMSLLREESNARLVLVGALDIGEFPGLAPFMDQIEILPIRHWSELPAAIAGVDINIIPLELTPFNEGKSNLKYYEAGLLQVPSIAAPTRINRESIRHGHNGLLARTTEEWYNGLKELFSSAERREQIGRNAFEHVLRTYTPEATAAEALEVYRQILHSHSRRHERVQRAGEEELSWAREEEESGKDGKKLLEDLRAESAANRQTIEAVEAERNAAQMTQRYAASLEWMTQLLETLRAEQEQVEKELRPRLAPLLDNHDRTPTIPPLVRNRLVCGIHVLKTEGAFAFLAKAARLIYRKLAGRKEQQAADLFLASQPHVFRTAEGGVEAEYKEWITRNEPTAADLAQQRRAAFPYRPRFSVIVTAYNTSLPYLLAAIESVRAQTYPHWELCIVSSGNHNQCGKRILDYYARNDSRIKVIFQPENQESAVGPNRAIALATGDYLTFLGPKDTLAPFALFEIAAAVNHYPDADFLYSDEDKITEQGHQRFQPHFKPAWSPDTLRSFNYIANLAVFGRGLLDKVGGFRTGFDGAQDYDLILRATEQTQRIVHVPKVLYHQRGDVQSAGEVKRDAVESAEKALREHLARCGLDARVQRSGYSGCYRILYRLPRQPLVSLIIPSKDQAEILRHCLDSIADSTYTNYEIVVVENNSCEPRTFAYYAELEKRPEVRIVPWNHPFNFAAATNFGARQSRGEVLLLLNNDMEIINKDWLESLLEHALRAAVGAVGAKLYYPNGTIQHGGVVVGLTGIAGHRGLFLERHSPGPWGQLQRVQNVSAVTGACLMTRRSVYEEVGGLDERFVLAFNDIDYCLKVQQRGYLNVWTPYAELYHFESLTRGYEDSPEKQVRLQAEIRLFIQKWAEVQEAGDLYYSPNLTLTSCDWAIRTGGAGPLHPRVVASRFARSLAA